MTSPMQKITVLFYEKRFWGSTILRQSRLVSSSVKSLFCSRSGLEKGLTSIIRIKHFGILIPTPKEWSKILTRTSRTTASKLSCLHWALQGGGKVERWQPLGLVQLRTFLVDEIGWKGARCSCWDWPGPTGTLHSERFLKIAFYELRDECES